ncbi:unnamed protein product [Rhizophagus irregularis]|nr:unnamed protein product [Rhizophagus irregularis]CAB5379171.1 unnamed protein product [Rhizophagus irregularis]
MNGNDLSNYEDVRTLADSAVNSALMKVTDMERRMKILEILAEMTIAYKSIKGLRAIKALNTVIVYINWLRSSHESQDLVY